MDKIELTSINLKIGKTIEETRKLKALLDELLGKEIVKEVHVHDDLSSNEIRCSTVDSANSPYTIYSSGQLDIQV